MRLYNSFSSRAGLWFEPSGRECDPPQPSEFEKMNNQTAKEIIELLGRVEALRKSIEELDRERVSLLTQVRRLLELRTNLEDTEKYAKYALGEALIANEIKLS